MGLFKRKKTEDPAKAQAGNPEEIDMSTGTAADVEEMMRKYDRESNTRIWEGTPQQIFGNPQNPRTQDFLRKVL